MIGTILFVLVFVGIGLTVVLAAMRSGRGPSRPTDGPSRGARRFTTIAVTLAILVIGLGLPALVLAVNANNHAKQGPGGVNLSEAQANGRELFTKNCGTCHTLAGSKTVGRVGPNLDELNGGNLKPAFILDAIHKGRARGQGQMPAGLLTGQDAQDVASYVAAVAGR